MKPPVVVAAAFVMATTTSRTLTTTPTKRRSSPYFAATTTTPPTPPTPPKKRKALEAQQQKETRKGSLPPLVHASVPPHTLFLGTQPSDNSLKYDGYYLTNANAFWPIVGDALGFRRDFYVDGRGDAVNFVRPHLLHDRKLDYSGAVDLLTAKGYAVWDVVLASDRKGSLDSAIRDASFNDVRGFLATYPSIRKICFSTGADSARRFKRAHKAWLDQGAFRPFRDDASRAVFGDLLLRGDDDDDDRDDDGDDRDDDRGGGVVVVELCVMESVSPAANPRPTWSAEKQKLKGFDDRWASRPAALYPYKRDQWFRVAFPHEPLVQAAPNFGDLDSHYR